MEMSAADREYPAGAESDPSSRPGFVRLAPLMGALLALQVAVLGLLAWRGCSPTRLAIHAALCLSYGLVAVAGARTKGEGDTCWAATWAAFLCFSLNTGGLESPFLPYGLS